MHLQKLIHFIHSFQNQKIKDQHHCNRSLENQAVSLLHQSTIEEVEDVEEKLTLKNRFLSGKSYLFLFQSRFTGTFRPSIRSPTVAQTYPATPNNPVKTYPSHSPQPAPPSRAPTTSLIPRRRQMREDPYKVAIRESHKISMERDIERNNLSYQIRMHDEKNRSNSIPSSTEPGFQIDALASHLNGRTAGVLPLEATIWVVLENLCKLALYDEIDEEKTKRLNKHLIIEKIKYKLGKCQLVHFMFMKLLSETFDAPFTRNNTFGPF